MPRLREEQGPRPSSTQAVHEGAHSQYMARPTTPSRATCEPVQADKFARVAGVTPSRATCEPVQADTFARVAGPAGRTQREREREWLLEEREEQRLKFVARLKREIHDMEGKVFGKSNSLEGSAARGRNSTHAVSSGERAVEGRRSVLVSCRAEDDANRSGAQLLRTRSGGADPGYVDGKEKRARELLSDSNTATKTPGRSSSLDRLRRSSSLDRMDNPSHAAKSLTAALEFEADKNEHLPLSESGDEVEDVVRQRFMTVRAQEDEARGGESPKDHPRYRARERPRTTLTAARSHSEPRNAAQSETSSRCASPLGASPLNFTRSKSSENGDGQGKPQALGRHLESHWKHLTGTGRRRTVVRTRAQEQSASVNNPAGPAAVSQRLRALVSRPANKRGEKKRAEDKPILLTQPGRLYFLDFNSPSRAVANDNAEQRFPESTLQTAQILAAPCRTEDDYHPCSDDGF